MQNIQKTLKSDEYFLLQGTATKGEKKLQIVPEE